MENIIICIEKIKYMLNTGRGRTGKPLPQKRIKSLKNKLKELETELNCCQNQSQNNNKEEV